MKRSKKRLAKGAMTAGVVAVTSVLGAGAAGAAGAAVEVPAPWLRDDRPALGDPLEDRGPLLGRSGFGPRCVPLPHGIPCDIFQRPDSMLRPDLSGPFPVGIPADVVVPVIPDLEDVFPHGIPAEPVVADVPIARDPFPVGIPADVVVPAIPDLVDTFPPGIPAELLRPLDGVSQPVAPELPAIVETFPNGVPADLLRAGDALAGPAIGVDASGLAGPLGHGPSGIEQGVTAAMDAAVQR